MGNISKISDEEMVENEGNEFFGKMLIGIEL